MFTRFIKSPFWIKLTNWEYWPFYIANIPVVGFWLYFAAQAKKLFFFTTVNPVIETGGVFGESKINILRRIPSAYIPKTIFIPAEARDLYSILNKIQTAELSFPIIAKPDVGERGFRVEKIEHKEALWEYLKSTPAPFLIQELVTYPVEISVLYHRMPEAPSGKVTSICIKKMLTVVGDGVSSVAELMEDYPRARLQLPRFRSLYPERLVQVPAAGEEVLLEPIGNHSRGTTFLNGNHYIDAQLERVFDQVGFEMDHIYYGRFDLKCESMEALRAGHSFKILEFNGVAGEPAHVYDPSYPLFKKYQDFYTHWKIIYQIARIQMAKGEQPMTVREMWEAIRKYRSAVA